MPRTSKRSAAIVNDPGPVEDRHQDLDGYTVNFLTFRQEISMTPLLVGLPDDRCQCPHWGYVVAGKLTAIYADREEEFTAGDAFYLPPGHTATFTAGLEYVQFSPTDELRVVEAAIERNMQAWLGA